MNPDDVVQEFHDRTQVQKSDTTAERYTSNVRKWVAWLTEEREKDIWEVNGGDFRMFVRYLLNEGYAPNTVLSVQSGVSIFYQALAEMKEEGYDIPEVDNPTEGFDRTQYSALRGRDVTKKAKHLREDVYYLQPEEVELLAQNVSAPKLRNRLIVKLLYQTGLRRGELSNIRLSDIDRRERSINIYAEKTHENRVVYYQPSLDTLLSVWIDAERNAVITADESPYLFPTKKSENIYKHHVTRIVTDAATEAGLQEFLYTDMNGNDVKKVSAHTLRHSFAVQSLKNGMNVRTVQKLLGHADIQTTMIYLKVAEDDVAEEARRYGPK
jgi:integrase/recombinase XerD